jgi:hypothetical protein
MRTASSPAATDAGDILRFPSETVIRFYVLIMLLIAEPVAIFALILPPGGSAYLLSVPLCGLRTGVMDPGIAARPGIWAVDPGGFTRCIRPAAAQITGATAGGVALLAVTAALLVWAQPRWQRRRWSLQPVSAAAMPDLHASLAGLVRLAGLEDEPAFLIDYHDLRPRGQAFGRPGRPSVRLSIGLAALFRHDALTFRGVVLHELAHVRNRDIGLTYLTVALWRAFILVVLPLWLADVIDPNLVGGHPYSFGLLGDLGQVPSAMLEAGLLTLLVYLSRNSVLRARELQADVRAASWDPATTELIRRAGRQPGWSRWLRWLSAHPGPAQRLAAISDPARLLRPSWLALALVTLVAAALGPLLGTPLVLALSTVHVDAYAAPWQAARNSILLAAPLTLMLSAMSVQAARRARLTRSRMAASSLAAGLVILAALATAPLVALANFGSVLSGTLASPGLPAVSGLLAEALLLVAAFAAMTWLRSRHGPAVPAARARSWRVPAVTAVVLAAALTVTSQLITAAWTSRPGGAVQLTASQSYVAPQVLIPVWADNGGTRQDLTLLSELDRINSDLLQAPVPARTPGDCSALRTTADAAPRQYPPIPDSRIERLWLTFTAQAAETGADCRSARFGHSVIQAHVVTDVLRLLSVSVDLEVVEGIGRVPGDLLGHPGKALDGYFNQVRIATILGSYRAVGGTVTPGLPGTGIPAQAPGSR